jgi:hypothetical protein
MTTVGNSENVRSRMKAGSEGKWEYGEKELSTELIWAGGFHHVTNRSCLACVLKFMNRLFIYFSNIFKAAVNGG